MNDAVNALVDAIYKSDEYIDLIKIKTKVEKDKVINELSHQIIELQKEMVKTGQDNKQVLDDLYYRLNNIDLYIEYLNARDHYNNMINRVNNHINNYINKLTKL